MTHPHSQPKTIEELHFDEVKRANSCEAAYHQMNDAFIKASDRIEELEKALRVARARIEYLGLSHPGTKHSDANDNTYLPLIDAALTPIHGLARAETECGK